MVRLRKEIETEGDRVGKVDAVAILADASQ
jgi:hypothetical protein